MAKIHDDASRMNQAEIITPTIISDQIIEPVVNTDFEKAVLQEAFMNEMVEIQLASTTDDNAPPHVTFNCNGLNQTFFRDVPVRCRRMFVELLARCKETKYTQIRDPLEMDRMHMKERTAVVYPFNVLHDPNPKGGAWLRAVMAEAN